MGIENTAPEEIQKLLKPLSGGTFTFACHPDVPCFTECCRDLKLLLTPYDILRLKNRLGMEASDFLDDYVRPEFDEERGLPLMFLEMKEDERRTCPFVSEKGCTVYEDRPAACRTYPVARASKMHRSHSVVLENYFILQEEHCKGFEEGRPWTVEEWIEDQGLEPYHQFNNLWMQLITHPRFTKEGSRITSREQQMFYLACYSLDKFRNFALSGRFLDIFEFTDDEIEAMKSSDEALLQTSLKWLLFSLCNEPALKTRNQTEG